MIASALLLPFTFVVNNGGDLPNFSISHDLFSDITADERFPTLPKQELTNLRGKKQNQNTSKSIKTGWMFSTSGKCNVTKRKSWKLCNIPCHELDAILCRFFAEIRKKDSQGYEPESLAVMQCSLDRHLKTVAVFCEIVNLQIQGNNLKGKQEN